MKIYRFIKNLCTTLSYVIFPKKKNILELERMSVVELFLKLEKSSGGLNELRQNMLIRMEKTYDGLYKQNLVAKNNPNFPKLNYAIFSYKDQRVKDLIWEIKYKKNEILISKIAEIVFGFLCENFESGACIIPVPQHKSLVREKGFNQSILIVKKLMEIDQESDLDKNENLDQGAKFIYNFAILKKSRKTKKQNKTSSRSERLTNLAGAFECLQSCRGRSFIIIDDVYTTGATTSEIRKVLMEAGASSVCSVCIAH